MHGRAGRAASRPGLTDPTRPQAVLLFVGPTGTGKTEIAKALAEYLFGSPDRLIRLDMSEYQTPAARGGCSATASASDASLVGRGPPPAVRGRAARRVREGRRRRSGTSSCRCSTTAGSPTRAASAADFRHAVIIMTSNLGAAVATSGGSASRRRATRFDPSSVLEAVARSVPARVPEPASTASSSSGRFAREQMRELLEQGARGGAGAARPARTRRGRSSSTSRRSSSSSSDGFTPELGARPLKRAVERYFLTPLALAIVGHDYPGGDQFLFVRAGRRRAEGARSSTRTRRRAGVRRAPAAGDAARAGARGQGLRSSCSRRRSPRSTARVSRRGVAGAKAELLARMGEPGLLGGRRPRRGARRRSSCATGSSPACAARTRC